MSLFVSRSSAACLLVALGVGSVACGSSGGSSPYGGSSSGGGSGGGSTSLTSTDAQGASELVVGAIWFLWGRDLSNYQFPSNGGTRNVSGQGNCLLSGSYSVTGTDRALPAGGGISETKTLTWTFTNCRHSNANGDVTLNGTVQEMATSGGPQGQPSTSDNETVTAGALTITGTVLQQDLSTTVTTCPLQENVQQAGSSQTYSGTLCSVAFP